MESEKGFSLNVTKQSSSRLIDRDSSVCGRQLLLSWSPSLAYQGNSTSGFHQVSFQSTSITSLISRVCVSQLLNRNESACSCVFLDNDAVIAKDSYMLSSEDLYKSFDRSSLSGRKIWLWVEMTSKLVNGSTLRVTSQRSSLLVGGVSQCATNSTGKASWENQF